ncbi:hypothetical protein LPJ61_004341 [Coemansia biformis]|uniref:RRM domain-containing protein n=1 Tax=Coemansia biformis TaxID=1286918 RepID=A0A9W7YC28_9FUNG|nr:hypothetical protein LPJ61_004341 [Coemansia biformis]
MDAPAFPKPGAFASDTRVQFVEETGCYVFTDPMDGTAYEFDHERGAWFPMWNESLVEQQQSAYGRQESEADSGACGERAVSGAQSTKRRARAAAKGNTSVYVSGLPRDATEEEMAEFFSQCGAIMPDLATNKPRVRLYRDGSGVPKGDGLVTYFKAPSVQLALDILDDSPFRAADSARIRVEEAEFGSKAEGTGDADKTKRPRVDTKLAQKRLDRLERQADVTLLLDLAEDVRGECERLGKVTSVKVYDGSEDGVVAVKFGDELAAGACVKVMNGRFFAGRQVEASIYDGRTRFGAAKAGEAHGGGAEASPDDERRMERYAQWLDSEG